MVDEESFLFFFRRHAFTCTLGGLFLVFLANTTYIHKTGIIYVMSRVLGVLGVAVSLLQEG